jgi:RimJ/RimL family protein N-acetyltransferase
MAKYKLTPAQMGDFQRCMDILNSGREFQRAQGFVQWADGYPDERSILADLQSGNGYVLKAYDTIAAYMYIGFDGDPSYPQIKGAWGYHEPYAVVHRIAIDSSFRGQGLSSITFRLVEDFCKSKGFYLLRIDTHEENKRMQHVLAKNGFAYCGIVMQNGGERLAYEKKL